MTLYNFLSIVAGNTKVRVIDITDPAKTPTDCETCDLYSVNFRLMKRFIVTYVRIEDDKTMYIEVKPIIEGGYKNEDR